MRAPWFLGSTGSCACVARLFLILSLEKLLVFLDTGSIVGLVKGEMLKVGWSIQFVSALKLAQNFANDVLKLSSPRPNSFLRRLGLSCV